MGFLMSYDRTKTLELGILDWEENNKMGFIWRIAWKQVICDKKLMDSMKTGLYEDYIHTQATHQSQTVTQSQLTTQG
jgi:hypothetical protein